MTGSSPEGQRRPPHRLDSGLAHWARVWNYLLGGKDNFAADREAGDMILQRFPGIIDTAREQRGFLVRAVRFLAAEAGIRQFLDIGVGLPVGASTHQVAQQLAPEPRVVYVDNDPLVVSHARALIRSSSQGRTGYVEADLRAPQDILRSPQLRATLDMRRPVGLMAKLAANSRAL